MKLNKKLITILLALTLLLSTSAFADEGDPEVKPCIAAPSITTTIVNTDM